MMQRMNFQSIDLQPTIADQVAAKGSNDDGEESE